MYLEVLNSENKILRKIEANIFDIENIRHDLIHQLVLWQLTFTLMLKVSNSLICFCFSRGMFYVI